MSCVDTDTVDGTTQDAGKLAPGEQSEQADGLMSTAEGAASGRRVALATLASLKVS